MPTFCINSLRFRAKHIRIARYPGIAVPGPAPPDAASLRQKRPRNENLPGPAPRAPTIGSARPPFAQVLRGLEVHSGAKAHRRHGRTGGMC